MVEHLLQNAAQAIRDSKIGDLETEKLRTSIYHHVAAAINIIANHAYTPGADPAGFPLTSPPRGGGGRGARTTGGPKTWTFAADLDLLK